jgi:hypothetical protein
VYTSDPRVLPWRHPFRVIVLTGFFVEVACGAGVAWDAGVAWGAGVAWAAGTVWGVGLVWDEDGVDSVCAPIAVVAHMRTIPVRTRR